MALPEASPDPDSKPSIGLVNELFTEAKREKRKRIKDWGRFYRLTRNKTWSMHREAWLPSPSSSEIFPSLATLVAWMLDQRPRGFVSPSPDVMEFSRPPAPELIQQLTDDMQQVLETWWVQRKMRVEAEKALWDTMTFGCGILKTGWDSSLNFGQGDAVARRIDPWAILPDPAGSSMEDIRYLLEVREVPIYELRARFGSRADRVKDKGTGERIDKRPDITEEGSGFHLVSPASTGVTGEFPGTSSDVPARFGRVAWKGEDYTKTVLLKELWVKNTRTEEIPYLENGTVKQKTWEIPYWEYIAEAGGVILNEDTANPFEHGELPYVRVPHIEIGEFWSVPLVEHMASGQIAINRLLAAMQLSAEMTGNPIFLEGEGSGIERTKIVSRPGGRLKYGTVKPEWMTPPQMSGDVLNLLSFWRESEDRTSGVSAVARGASLRRREPAAAVDSAQEAAFVRIRATLGHLEEALRGVENQVASNCVQFFLEPRTIAKVGPSGVKGYLQLGARHFHYPDATPDGVVLVPLHFDTYVDASSLPLNREARASQMLSLFFAGLADPRTVLEAHDVPDRERAIQWAEEQAKLAASAGASPGKNPRRG